MDSPLEFEIPVVMRPSSSTVMVDSVTLQRHGTVDEIVYKEVPLPKELEDDHVEVEVDCCGLNYADNYLRLGIVRQRRFPVVMGSECAGRVKRVGSQVKSVQVGQNVLCLKMYGGLFRRIVHVPEKNCFIVPEHISGYDPIGLGLDFLTAYVCLFDICGLKKNQSVFMQSVGGGIGTSVVQLAKTVPGVKVFGTAGAFKQEYLEKLGVQSFTPDDEKCKEKVLRAVPGGVDIFINTNGAKDIEECFQLLKPLGKLILLGSNSTVVYPKVYAWGLQRPTWDVKKIETTELISGNHFICGLNIGRFIEGNPERVRAILTEIFTMFDKEIIEPVIDSDFPLEKINTAFNQLCTRSNYGKVVLWAKRSRNLLVQETLLEPYVQFERPQRTKSSGGKSEPGDDSSDEAGTAAAEAREGAAAEARSSGPAPQATTSGCSATLAQLEAADAILLALVRSQFRSVKSGSDTSSGVAVSGGSTSGDVS